jgi:amino acid adenylation domain-containing protein
MTNDDTSIAIIGLAGRFPGAADVRTFWQNLCAGQESVRTFTDEELRAAGIPEHVFRDPAYIRTRAVLDQPEWFDADFFGMTPREAELTDPQHRVFLECAWSALEDAALDPARYPGTVGVFAGASLNTYLLDNIGSHREQIAEFVTHFQTDGYPLLLGADKDYLATRCAYKFNLRGPAVTIQTACSTSLVAVVQAVHALLGFQCDAALAGGVSISFPQERGHLYQEGAIASGNGQTRAFDADAQGTVFGSGCGVVVLKRLADARADGDHIYAIIRGAAVNNDGAGKVSYVAPSVQGQAECIALAHALAGVTADQISYVEAHGTATPLGDPIEIAALTQAFRATTDKKQFCLIGTAKTNIGHLESAAGITGLIKTALALEHGLIPPSLHFSTPNPRIDFANGPFTVVTTLTEWKSEAPRLAGVSSFGVGGTNAHVVLEAPATETLRATFATPQLLVLSARTLRALEDATAALAAYLTQNPALDLAAVAHTLQTGRQHFTHRRFVVASSLAEAARLLRRRDRHRVFTSTPKPAPPANADALTTLGLRWLAGESIEWPAHTKQKIPLPTYPFQRQRHWIEPRRELQIAPATVSSVARSSQPATSASSPSEDSFGVLIAELTALSGRDLSKVTRETTLLDLDFDSLFLTQLAIALQKKFGVKLRFRQLLDELDQLGTLADYCAQGTATRPAPAATETSASKARPHPAAPAAFGPFRPLQKEIPGGLTAPQHAWLEDFIRRYTARTPASKSYTAKHRAHLADPRAVAGFKDVWKEMVYPIVAARSAGAHLFDLDGNDYVDTTMGFGLALFGHQPDFVMRAIEAQMRLGMEIGPASPLAGEVAALMCELTGLERCTFCNTGSEAVLGAIRIARTVTGRSKIALFAGAYHGINDEALVRPLVVNGEWRTAPIAPGIIQDAVANVLVLEYGNPESLDILRRHAGELAAVLVEPVQSRRPDLQPRDFLHALRALTAEHGIAMIMDEVITGFRTHPGGAQAHFGVQADIATYGKIIGGGLPIGAICGRAEYMDAFDGGAWQYGDASYPTAGVTFFAGTFVRHPLALAASKAVLEHLRAAGPALQRDLAEKNARMHAAIAPALAGTPFELPHFSSLFFLRAPDFKFSGLLYALLRHRGVHIWEGRPCFLSTAHTEADIAHIVRAFHESLAEMREAGFFCENTAAPSPASVPLCEAQREIWLAAQLGSAASAAFNETCTLELHGPLDEPALRRAITEVIARHDALRAAFSADGEMQHFSDALTTEVPLLEATAEELATLRAAEGIRHFDLANGPLVAFTLVRLGPEHHALLFTAHHIACDGWSYDILLRELAALYCGETLPPARQFRDYLRWETEQQQSTEAAAAEQYWRGQFRDLPPPLELPADRPRPPQRSWRGARTEINLPLALKQATAKFGAHHGATLFATVLAAFQTLLHRLTGARDLVIGIPSAGQNLAGGHDLVGHAANLLPLRQPIDGADPFPALLAETKKRLLDAFDHAHFTYGRLLQQLRIPRDPARPPLVSVIFNLDPPLSDLRFGRLRHELSLNPRQHYQFDLGFCLVDEPGGLRVQCDYNPDLFDAATIQRWLGHYRTLLEAIVAGEAHPPLLSQAERTQVLVAWNQTARPYPADEPITTRFERFASEQPNAIAIVEAEKRVTYAELNSRANRVARDLAAQIAPGDLVGLEATRSTAFIAAALGILKAGGAYVPLSPDDPPERRAKLAADCRVVLDLETVPQRADTGNPAPRSHGGSPAYVLFTSGSTGTPKGVVVPHRAIARLVVNSDYVSFQKDDVVAHASNLCFDAATFELWGALLNGGTLVVTPPDALLTPQALGEHLARHRITTLFLTTSLFHQMAQQAPAMFAELRNLVFGGEAADAHCVRLVLENGRPQRLINGYGPTETTTFAVCHLCEHPEAKVPIGRPIANTTAFVLDAQMRPVPIGVAGDLYIGGPGVALGYHGAPELTAERFLETAHGRLYRTGDLARWRPDGTLDYLGRRDQQIKVRGFRVEPGEIEAALRAAPGVGDCAVIVRDKQLIAYITPNGSALPTVTALRDQLARVLPAWMLPAAFVRVEKLPLTANGKLDVRALPAPEFSSSSSREVRPETTLQMQLLEIWQETLGRGPVGLHDDFFELGGHSLLAAKMLATVEQRLGRRVPFSVLFERATVAHLAGHLVAEQRRAAADQPLVTVQPAGAKTPLFFLHGDFSGGGFYCRSLARHLGEDRPFHALHPHGLHGETVPPTIEAMATERIAAVRARQPRGPYLLGGFCNGALVAYEMARQLAAAGEAIEAVVLIGADGSNFAQRHMSRLAHGVTKLLGEDHAAGARRFREWKRWARQKEAWAKAQVQRVAALAEKPAELPAKIERFVKRKLRPAPADLSPDCIAVAEAPPTVLAAYMAALEAYVPGRFDGRIILVWAEEDKPPQGDIAFGWRELCRSVEIITVPGEHQTSMALEAHLQILGARLRAALSHP